MSGRPADPSYAVQSWDNNNYPAGGNDWNATPKRVAPPSGTYISPNDGSAAQYANFIWGAGFDADANHKAAITAAQDMVGQGPALNWRVGVIVDATKQLVRGHFGVKDQTWYGVGNGGTDWGMQSQDYGQSWTALTLGSSLTLQDVTCDANGNVLITANSRTVYVGSRSAYGSVTFAATALALSAVGTGTCTYDAVNAKFIAAYRVGATGHKIDYSSNGTAFSAGTLPSAWTSYTGGNDPRVNANAIGTAVAAFYDENANLLRIIASTNGGSTWADEADIAPAFTPSGTYTVSKPTYDDQNGVWYVALAQQSTTRKTQIFYSTNGGTSWNSLNWTANDFCAQGLVALGSLIVACNDDGRIAFSTGSAASLAFQWTGKATATATPVTMAGAGGGGLGIFYPGARTFISSFRFGIAGQAI